PPMTWSAGCSTGCVISTSSGRAHVVPRLLDDRAGDTLMTSPPPFDRRHVLMASALLIAACHAPNDGVDGGSDLDRYQSVFESVSDASLMQRMNELTGATPVTAGGKTFRITNRWAPVAKSDFRAYWKQSMEALGATVTETTFPISNLVGETMGHNMEAILP